MPEGLRLALTTLTVARVGRPAQVDRRTAGQAMELAPLVGLLVGFAAALVLIAFRLLADFRTAPLLPVSLTLATLALLTRGLHLDGLADTVDGLGSYRDPAGTRAVMKAPDLGPLGMSTVVLVLLVQFAALVSCVDHGRGTASLITSVVTGRLAITWACAYADAATDEGLGAMVARTVRRPVPWLWTATLLVLAAAYSTVDKDQIGSDLEQATRTVIGILVGLGLAAVVARHVLRRVGGLTGDVLGALCEIATTACLVVLGSGVVGQ